MARPFEKYLTPDQLEQEYKSAYSLWPFLHDLEDTYSLPPFLLFAVGSRETNLHPKLTQGETGDGGHGHGVFQLDDRWHDIPSGFDTDINAQAHKAADMLRSLFASEKDWERALNRYNSGSPDVNRTTGKDYGPDVLSRLHHFQFTFVLPRGGRLDIPELENKPELTEEEKKARDQLREELNKIAQESADGGS